MFKMIVGVLFPLLALAPIASAQAACDADNCLRAVRNTAPAFSGKGTADCKSFFQATSTPPTLTFTATSYVTILPDATTGIVTNTATITPDIVTSIISITEISTPVPTTAVITETSVITSTVTINGEPAALTKRQAATFPPLRVPAYASACAGVLKYANACSCIGVPRSTITATAPSTTTTATVLVTALPSTVLVTQPATTTLSTVTTVVTSLTTLTLDPSTTTVSSTQTDFTTLTSTNIPDPTAPACATVPTTCASPKFYIQVTEGSGDGWFARVIAIGTITEFVRSSNSKAQATVFSIDSDGQLLATYKYLGRDITRVVYYQKNLIAQVWNVFTYSGQSNPRIPSDFAPIYFQLGNGGAECPGSSGSGSSGSLIHAGCDAATFQSFGFCNSAIYSMRKDQDMGFCTGGSNNGYLTGLNFVVV
ncbi:hypothetical protein VTL71DRAFT_2223 [Oculimacula yallundae]|uniref:Uncharacterized protein n=1 Tax=Oculimacula yallundae TaxID=86028 RepID=A0ABR4C9G7_9HELO